MKFEKIPVTKEAIILYIVTIFVVISLGYQMGKSKGLRECNASAINEAKNKILDQINAVL